MSVPEYYIEKWFVKAESGFDDLLMPIGSVSPLPGPRKGWIPYEHGQPIDADQYPELAAIFAGLFGEATFPDWRGKVAITKIER